MIEKITIKGNRKNITAEIGFDNYEQALKRANGDEYSLAAVFKRNGSSFYEYAAGEKIPFDMMEFYDDDPDRVVLGNAKEYSEYIQMYVIDELNPSDYYDNEDYQDAIQEVKEFIDKIMNMNIDGKFFLVNPDDYTDYKIIDRYKLRFNHDNKHYEVAVLI